MALDSATGVAPVLRTLTAARSSSPARGEVGAALSLPDLIFRAQMCFDAGDMLAALDLAQLGYVAAKSAARFAASERLLAKARALQGDALMIEARAKIRIADEYDAAQERGEASKGRPKTLPDGKTFTAEQAGLTHKQIHEARALRDAEKAEPGIAQRAIAARLEQGLEPTKAFLGAAVMRGIGTRSASKEERGDDFYQTPVEAIRALLAVERFGPKVFEPFCGLGAISKPLEAAGYELLLNDLNDRGCLTCDGVVQNTADFLTLEADWLEAQGFAGCDIVSNPPFGQVNACLFHALTKFRPRKMAMLLNLNALCGADDEERNFWMETWLPARILVFTRRLPMMHRDGWDGPVSGSQMNCAWFIWEAGPDAARPYGGQTLLQRIDWKDYVEAAPISPLRVGDACAASREGDAAPEERDEGGGAAVLSDDGLYHAAIGMIAGQKSASTSFLQHRLMLSYNSAARLIERMEAEGIVSAPDAGGKRRIIFEGKPPRSPEREADDA
jgi:Ftsk gamma domain